jgi:phytoene synthase
VPDNSASPASASQGPEDLLLPTITQSARLALSYATASSRLPTLALFALDQRLAGLLRHSREPMLALIRLAWWRETLGRDASEWPEGEPLLNALRSWNGAHKPLAALVDGWEALTGPAPLPPESLQAMAEGRGAAFAALAEALGRPEEAEAASRIGRRWALADLASHLRNPEESVVAQTLARETSPGSPRLSRSLRPLLVLQGLAQHRLATGSETSPGAVVKAMRLGLLGF